MRISYKFQKALIMTLIEYSIFFFLSRSMDYPLFVLEDSFYPIEKLIKKRK